MKKGIKTPKQNKSSRFTFSETPNYNNMPPIFSLERIVGGKYCFSSLDNEGKKQFAESIFKRRNLDWGEIESLGRHKLGTEKILKKDIKGKIPKFVTEDMAHFLAFRFNGKKPMVGYREKNIFYVLWFDLDLTLYKH